MTFWEGFHRVLDPLIDPGFLGSLLGFFSGLGLVFAGCALVVLIFEALKHWLSPTREGER